MTAYMYDAAFAPNLAACKRHGAIAMSHYMTRSYASTSAQPDAIRSAGMGVVFNWEGMANELVGASRAKGQAVGREALASLPRAVPRDGTVKIVYSVDDDVTNLAACDEAFRGINDAHKGSGVLVGTYAEGGLIERLHALGLVQGGQWLSMSEGFGGFAHALKSGLVAVVQMHDAAGRWIGTDIPNTDRNTVIDPHALGAWWPDGSPYARPPANPTVARKEIEMIVVQVDPATVPKGATAPSMWFTFDGTTLDRIEVPAGGVNNGTNLLAALGQKAPVNVTYTQYQRWGGK